MTTTNEDATDQPAAAESLESTVQPNRTRRFGPRRSRSAKPGSELTAATPSTDEEAAAAPPVTGSGITTEAAASTPALDRAGEGIEDAASRPALYRAGEGAEPATAAGPDSEVDPSTGVTAVMAAADEIAPTLPLPETAAPAAPARRRSRSRKAPSTATVTAAADQVDSVPAVTETASHPVGEVSNAAPRARSRRSRRTSEQASGPVASEETALPDAVEAAPDVAQATAPRTKPSRPRRSRTRSRTDTPAAELAGSTADQIAVPPTMERPAAEPSTMERPAAEPATIEPPAAEREAGDREAAAPFVAEEGPDAAPELADLVSPEAAPAQNGDMLVQDEVALEPWDFLLPATEHPSSPGESSEDLLTRALRELFPPVEVTEERAYAESESGEPAATAEQEDLPYEDDAFAEDLAPDTEPGSAESAAEAARRRGRRGRRGGRGRRRNGTLIPASGVLADTLGVGDVAQELGEVAQAALAAKSTSAPVPLAASAVLPTESEAALFVPEVPARTERSWRERGLRRPWGRTYPREERPTASMPPPKPSIGLRHGPLPQAVPPLVETVEEPPLALPTAPAFTLPDLRIDEPLRPGETRTERLLEAQTMLLKAMIEQQSRQLELLTATVTGLRQSIQQLSTARTYLPRTAIFVDAPNVCYAADNARVNLDFGRMLKYLSKDRHLVHALSYAPITDDVREGIRYETQRFVAPFLRSGYKLVTKPLKRFSDGSAKGNFDIELAIDIATMAERLDIVVLVSGDSDFERLIQLIQSKGVRVEVVAFASNASTELVNIADVFIDINQHLEHMRAL